jgi:hypothetical protein
MPNTFTKIASVTVGSGGSSTISFTSIPSTYTDLVLLLSGRSNSSNVQDGCFLTINGVGTNRTFIQLSGNGSNAVAGSGSDTYIGNADGGSSTSNTFNNCAVYLPNYAGSTNKSFSVDIVAETNATTIGSFLTAGLWSQTTAINALSFNLSSFNFVQYSTATLYGIKNS